MSKNRLTSTPSFSRSSLNLFTFTCLTYFIHVVKPSEYELHVTISRSPEGEKVFLNKGTLDETTLFMLDIFSPSSTPVNGTSTPPSHCDNQNAPTHFQMLTRRVVLAWVQNAQFYTLASKTQKAHSHFVEAFCLFELWSYLLILSPSLTNQKLEIIPSGEAFLPEIARSQPKRIPPSLLQELKHHIYSS